MKKVGLKLNIQKTEIMASDPITSWQIVGEKVEAVTISIFLGSQITVDRDYSDEIKSARPSINNLRYADDTTLMAVTKEPLDECERGE